MSKNAEKHNAKCATIRGSQQLTNILMSLSQFALGQRWLSNTESDLGLGTVVATDKRSVTLLFPVTGENRVYAAASAPLTRIEFSCGDTIASQDGWELEVTQVAEQNGMLSYHGIRTDNGEQVQLRETMLDHHIKLNQPEKRLFNGQLDDPKWFDLRSQCLTYQHRHPTCGLAGFLGARVQLIPHQLHIAAEVGQRHAPRVLLADEVGLGKTIEAALIIHQQLLTNRAKRVLIVVPSSLVHQWLVEMLRRVNLAFSVFDETRCKAMAAEGGNPFEAEQLVLCSLDFITHNSQYYQQALQAEWDLLVVDEAHHLTWSQGQPSQQYQAIEGLANATPGVLLLTATPDQLGHESHFARLRLLDPARFHDYQRFIAEEHRYSQLATAISPLISGQALESAHMDALEQFSSGIGTELAQANAQQKQQVLHRLLDQHGTGRILFRNSRAGISGFPRRRLQPHPLPLPAQYQQGEQQQDDLILTLHPEQQPQWVDSWTEFDPRVTWLINILAELRGHKVLTICASARTALQLAEALRCKTGIRHSVFHEGMSIVERDKAANYFADEEDGAQVLICSEIGSEGRNFQFAHHLVLFDLPLVPDLLEQRIGRLDRIGQQHEVQIHVPYFSNHAQEVLLHWYHQGLDAFEHTCPTGTSVLEETGELLLPCLRAPQQQDIEHLLQQTASLQQKLKQRLEQGRDRLLELNSSGKGRIEALLQQIRDEDDSPQLERFMTALFDAIGVTQEDKDECSYILRPSESMVSQLPGLNEEGMTVTYERATATTLEQIHYLSWDHPMVHHAMDMVTTDTLGKSSVCLVTDPSLPVGAYWLECLFVLSAKAQPALQLQRFLPATPIRICIDAKGQLCDTAFVQINKIKHATAMQLVNALQSKIATALAQASAQGEKLAAQIRQQAEANLQQVLGQELSRLQQLQKVNPAIRDDEIAHVQQQITTLDKVIANAEFQFDAVRLLVNNR